MWKEVNILLLLGGGGVKSSPQAPVAATQTSVLSCCFAKIQ